MALVLDYNTITAVRGGGKRKAASLEDEHSREEKKARQVNQSLIEVCTKKKNFQSVPSQEKEHHYPSYSLLFGKILTPVRLPEKVI